MPDGRIGTYRYGADGARTAVTLAGQLVRRYVYGGGLFPQARIDAAGRVLERYVYAAAGAAPDLIVRRDGQRLRPITDATGSVRATIDADTGLVLQRLSYDAYGQVTQDTSPGLQPFGFKGAVSDPVAAAAGLVWMGAPSYQPELARFTTPDPNGLAASWNQTDALGGDPINLIDPDGQFPVAVHQFITSVGNGIGNGVGGLIALGGAAADFLIPGTGIKGVTNSIAGSLHNVGTQMNNWGESDGFAWPQRDGLKWPHLALVDVVVG